MEMGSVRKILDSHFPEGIPESAASPIIRDILLGLVHLHERGIVHRALKVNYKHSLEARINVLLRLLFFPKGLMYFFNIKRISLFNFKFWKKFL